MTDLEDRLRALADAPVPGPAASSDLHRRARRRTQRRRAVVVGVPLALVAVVAAVVAARPDERGGTVNAGPGPSTTAAPSTTNPPTRQIGGLEGVTLTVTPSTDLRDGDQLAVSVDQGRRLRDASVVFCAGNATLANATATCDLTLSSDPLTIEEAPGQDGSGRTTATARRFLHLPALDPDDPNDDAYDCATEPVGCVLVVVDLSVPTQAVLVPVTFLDEPPPTPTLVLDRATGLHADEPVTATAEGLQPNGRYTLATCRLADGGAGPCDELRPQVDARADADGRLSATVVVSAGFYSSQGRTDCTVDACGVSVLDDAGHTAASRAVAFAADVEFPEPTLATDPAGPFTDGQEVTLSGAGFPPGLELGGALGVCPADKDPAVEERCGYPTLTGADGQPSTVGPDGTFAVSFPLSRIAGWGQDCATTPGCVISWVLDHGPAAVSLPIVVGP